MKILLSIVLASFALPAFAGNTLVTCTLKNGSKGLKVEITAEANDHRALVTLQDSTGSRLISDKEVHSVYANGYSAFESADNEFYLLIHQGTGDSKLDLATDAGDKKTFSLYCNIL